MKIVCFVDELGSGGAQRQLVTMAQGFQRRGHGVHFLVYHPGGHFLPALQATGLPITCLSQHAHLKRFLKIRRFLRGGGQDVVLAFLEAPALYAELAGLPARPWGLVVGERSAHPQTGAGWRRWLRWPHKFADAVVANSHTNRLMLERAWPQLEPKLHTIYNGLDLDRFKPLAGTPQGGTASASIRLVVVASYQQLKNMMGLGQALLLLRGTGIRLAVDWYGATAPDPRPLREIAAFISTHGLSETFRLHPPIQGVETEYQRADAVGLFSEYEGLPNVVCEGMACGRPIVMSDVCDARRLVQEGENGFLCDPHAPASIAQALRKLALLGPDERARMGRESRRRAERLFNPQTCFTRYEKIMEAAARCARQASHAPASETNVWRGSPATSSEIPQHRV